MRPTPPGPREATGGSSSRNGTSASLPDPRVRRYFHWYWTPQHDARRRSLDHASFLSREGIDPIRLLRPRTSGRYLEIGAGTGSAALALARHAGRVVALDVSPVGLARIRSASSAGGVTLPLVTASGETLPFADATFDGVLVQTTAMHMGPDPLADEIIRVLRPGGRFVLIEPRAYHPIVAVYRSLVSDGRGSGPRYLTRRDVARVAARFRRARMSSHGLLTPLVAPWAGLHRWVARLDRRLLRGPARRLAWFTLLVAER